MFMHIAHYNRHGFYETWCDTSEKRLNLLCRHIEYPCAGDPAWTWSDVEREIQIWLAESGIARAYEFEAQTERRHHLTAAVSAALTELPDQVVLRLVQARLAPDPATPNEGKAAVQARSHIATIQSLTPSTTARFEQDARSEQQMLFEL